jgi:glycosyltransferase involved in cell wall biosynthesis
MTPPKLSIIVNAYTESGNAAFASNLMSYYAAMPIELKQQFEIIIVDDHSPVPITAPLGVSPLYLRILRIDEDIPWNQPGARNLGVIHARCDGILMHDLGQCAPETTLRKLIKIKDAGRSIYKFPRLDEEDNSRMIEHPNTLFLSRGRFLRYYGYDEEFAGHYGLEDSTFVRLQRRMGAKIKIMSKAYPITHRKKDEDYCYATLNRDLTFNTQLMKAKLAKGRLRDESCFSRKFLNFRFHLVQESSLDG